MTLSDTDIPVRRSHSPDENQTEMAVRSPDRAEIDRYEFDESHLIRGYD